jgi:hypothetical protein
MKARTMLAAGAAIFSRSPHGLNLDPLPGTVTPSRRSARHGIVSGNNDAAARDIAAAVLRRYCQELSGGGVTWITSHRARLNTFQNGPRSAGGKPVIGTARSGRGLTRSAGSTDFGPERHEHLPHTLSDRPDDLVVFRLGEQFQRGRPHASPGTQR